MIVFGYRKLSKKNRTHDLLCFMSQAILVENNKFVLL